jgi:hypothetical protein
MANREMEKVPERLAHQNVEDDILRLMRVLKV